MSRFEVFTTALVKSGQIQHLDDHVQRLRDHAAHFGIPYPGDPFIIASEALQSRSCTKSLTKTSENFLNVGRGLDRFTVVRDDEKPHLIRISLSRDGFSFTTRTLTPPQTGPIIITDIQVDPRFKHFKTTEREPYDRAATIAKKVGALEALLIDEEGFVVDGTRSSPLLLRDNVLISLEGGLRGITREHVLSDAQSRGLKVRREKLKPADLLHGTLMVAGSGLGLISNTKRSANFSERPNSHSWSPISKLEEIIVTLNIHPHFSACTEKHR